MRRDNLIKMAKDAGFTGMAPLKVASLEFLTQVRDMCAHNRCNQYGRCWTCPPACGSLEESKARAAKYTDGLLVQTTGTLEDDFDYESMQRLHEEHKERFANFYTVLQRETGDVLPMGSGGCSICTACTYPDAPCRYPSRAITSMEAYGLLVSDVCQQSGLPYYYGPGTLTYVGCYLF